MQNPGPKEWRLLANLASGSRNVDPDILDILYEYEARRGSIAHRHARLLVSSLVPRDALAPFESLGSVFGISRADHSFSARPVNWGFSLTEPQVTKALAYFLDQGPPDVRARRLDAFLRALGSGGIPSHALLRKAVVLAESDRIDLQIRIPIENSSQFQPVIIEAKFDHRLTEGQLKRYTDVLQKDESIDEKRADLVLLGLSNKVLHGLSDEARDRLIGCKYIQWRVVLWANIWVQFERLRPEEDDPDFPIFLHTLWNRIGGLTKGCYHA